MKPKAAIIDPIIVVLRQPYRLVKIEAIGPLARVTAGRSE